MVRGTAPKRRQQEDLFGQGSFDTAGNFVSNGRIGNDRQVISVLLCGREGEHSGQFGGQFTQGMRNGNKKGFAVPTNTGSL